LQVYVPLCKPVIVFNRLSIVGPALIASNHYGCINPNQKLELSDEPRRGCGEPASIVFDLKPDQGDFGREGGRIGARVA
jgi:hypothetical protein